LPGKDDREVFTSSLPYLQHGDYFSCDEFLGLDRGFESDGCLRCSYKNPANDEIIFNLAWRKVRIGVENSFQQTGASFLTNGMAKHIITISLGFFVTVQIRNPTAGINLLSFVISYIQHNTYVLISNMPLDPFHGRRMKS
jgi:hypothetical protein